MKELIKLLIAIGIFIAGCFWFFCVAYCMATLLGQNPANWYLWVIAFLPPAIATIMTIKETL